MMGYSANQINININSKSVLKIIGFFTASTRRIDTEQRRQLGMGNIQAAWYGLLALVS